MPTAGGLDALSPAHLATFAFVSARVGGVMLTAPVWSMRLIPTTVRGAFAVVVTLTLLPRLTPVAVPSEPMTIAVRLAGELLFGVTMGLAASIFVFATQVAAEVIGVQMGLSIAATLTPTASGAPPGLGELQNLMALAIYLAVGGHLLLVGGLVTSLDVIPPGGALDVARGAQLVSGWGTGLFAGAVRVAAPVMVALVVTNLALAILGKAVPQINVLMLAFPVTIGAGLIVFGAALPFLGKLTAYWASGVGGAVEAAVAAFTAPPLPVR